MLKALYWRINLSLKKIKSKRLKKKLGKNVKAIITESKNGIFAVDPEDLEAVSYTHLTLPTNREV